MVFTDQNVHEIIASGQPVVIDFWATWCGPCVRMAPIVDELAQEYEGKAVIGKYNIEEENDLAMKYRIMSSPPFFSSRTVSRYQASAWPVPSRRTPSRPASTSLSRFNFRQAKIKGV